MNKTLFFAALVSTALSLSATAGDWAEEPPSIADIVLDKPLSESVHEPCPVKELKIGKSTKQILDISASMKLPEGQRCYHQEDMDKLLKRFQVLNLRVPPMAATATITTRDGTLEGNVEWVKFEFLSSNYPTVRDMFTTKFGAPHSVRPTKLKTKGGAEFDAEELKWKGNNVSISVDSLATRHYETLLKMLIEKGEVLITTSNYRERRADEFKQKAEEGASKL